MNDLNRAEASRKATTETLRMHAQRMAALHEWMHRLFADIHNIDADLQKPGAELTTYEHVIMREVHKFVQNLGEPVLLVKDDFLVDLKKLCKRTALIVSRLEKLAKTSA